MKDDHIDAGRRRFLKNTAVGAAALTVAPYIPGALAKTRSPEFSLASVDVDAAKRAKMLADGKNITLTIMQPSGSLGNIKPVAERWTKATGIKIAYNEVPLEQINQKVMLDAVTKRRTFDLALPATFGIPDLASSGILADLRRYEEKYQPAGYMSDVLYPIGNYYQGRPYGYLTDGDVYLMFYLKDWLDDPEEQKKFEDQYGYKLGVPKTWEQLDQMMKFFYRPHKNMYGGALFRTRFFIAWEFWVRFQAKGYYPFDADMHPQINNDAGVKALEELTEASKYLYPGARSNGLFENFQAFGAGGKFCDIGWGGTQKYLNSDKSSVRGKLAYGPMPGGYVGHKFLNTSYFNWGWDWVVSTLSPHQEICYLYALYADSPKESTIAIRDQNGYFDPFRKSQYSDPWIQKTYTKAFLKVQEAGLMDAMPDLYLRGHGEYFDALRDNVQAADTKEKTPKKALDDTAAKWEQITERLGRKDQVDTWTFLRAHYPSDLKGLLKA